MSLILAIDPGTTHSGVVSMLDGKVLRAEILENREVLDVLRNPVLLELHPGARLAIEMIASYGMAVGREVFETCVWIGRFVEAWNGSEPRLIPRLTVKLHLCKSPKANDASIRQALIDRYGPGKDKAIGKKASQGPLYGVSADVWAALALAVTWQDTRAQRLAV